MKFTLYKTTLSTSKLIRQGENFTYKQQMMLRLFVNLGGFLKANSSVAGFTRQIEAIIKEGREVPDFKNGACVYLLHLHFITPCPRPPTSNDVMEGEKSRVC